MIHQNYKNMMQTYLEEFLGTLGDREIIILGCYGISATIYSALRYLGHDILYFLNPEPNIDKTTFFGKAVYPCHHLLYENTEHIAVINAHHYIEEADFLLNSYGLIKNKDYYDLHNCLKSRCCNVLDPVLGYSRMDDMQGIRIFGNDDGHALKIVAIGGSTTDYSYSDIKSWPEFLHHMLNEKGISNIIYNCGILGYSSCQERDKFIRDILGLHPDIVLSLSGVNDINWTLIDKEHPYYADYYLNKIVKGIYFYNSEHNKLSYGIKQKSEDYENWYHNEKIIYGVASAFQIKYYTFLQPFIFEGNYQMSEFEKGWMEIFLQHGIREHQGVREIFEGSQHFYQGARKKIADTSFIFDITNAFDNVSGVYTDGVHCDEIGNRLLAEAILQKLEEAGELH